MTPMDGGLQASVPNFEYLLMGLEKDLKNTKESGKPLTENQQIKIKELFKRYSTYSEATRATKFANYPLSVEQFNKLVPKHKIP
jgi:hypothetical protein